MFLEEHGAANDLPQAAAGSFQNLRKIAQDAVGLRGYVSADHLLRRGIDGDLSRGKNKSVGFDGLRVGPDGLRCVFGRNDFAHKGGPWLLAFSSQKDYTTGTHGKN